MYSVLTLISLLFGDISSSAWPLEIPMSRVDVKVTKPRSHQLIVCAQADCVRVLNKVSLVRYAVSSECLLIKLNVTMICRRYRENALVNC